MERILVGRQMLISCENVVEKIGENCGPESLNEKWEVVPWQMRSSARRNETLPW